MGCRRAWGTHVNWDERMDGLLAQAVMSLQAVKAVELGRGVTAASSAGSAVHDAIGYSREIDSLEPEDGGAKFTRFTREKNNAGGIEGGISNGEDVVVRGVLEADLYTAAAAGECEVCGGCRGKPGRHQGGV